MKEQHRVKRYIAVGGHYGNTVDAYIERKFADGRHPTVRCYNAPYVHGNCKKRFSPEHVKVRAIRIAIMLMYFVLLEK